ncbi:MAG: NADH-quinone oxidoreductase subunit J [Elusimicrobiales bacterium]|nr:NADH-quinone oxidoreductase subunit J [Elusimicrobiales bacterium]
MKPLLLNAAFYLLSGAVLAGAAGVVLLRRPLYCALSLLFTLLATSALYILLGAELAGYLQIIVYAGAVMALFILAIHMTGQDSPLKTPPLPRLMLMAAGAGAAGLFALLMLASARFFIAFVKLAPEPYSIAEQAGLIFGRYAPQFELLSLLVLSGVAGAVITAKKKL